MMVKGSILRSINPSNYELVGQVPTSSPEEVQRKVWRARRAAPAWGEAKVRDRIAMIRKALREFEQRKSEVARLESQEMGKPISVAQAEWGDQALFANWYCDNVERCLTVETTLDNKDQTDRVFRQPLGVTAVIIPWNYPFLMFVWTAIPNLLAGNTVVLKHSEGCPLMGKLIEEVMTRHLPPGVFSEVYGDGRVGEMLANDDVDLIHFTGSKRTGHKLYEIAARKFIRVIMELGGSAPGIVFADADLEAAAHSFHAYRLSNSGQYCDGLKRGIVHRRVLDKFADELVTIFDAVKVGPAEDPCTEMGPLVSQRQLDLLHSQVDDAFKKGAQIYSAGPLPKDKGAFYQPTIITGVTKEMRVWKEEVFGPVLPLMSFGTEEEAIALANDTEYGLGGYVYTADLKRAERVARALKTGMVSINGTNYTAPHNPFGGWKHSGIGREHGKWGFHDLTQVKVVARPK